MYANLGNALTTVSAWHYDALPSQRAGRNDLYLVRAFISLGGHWMCKNVSPNQPSAKTSLTISILGFGLGSEITYYHRKLKASEPRSTST